MVTEHNGNILVAGGVGANPSVTKLRELPVTLLAHLDEITYYVGKMVVNDFRIVSERCY